MSSEPVKLIECPRDAWQGLPKQIPTELKVRYLRALIDAEFKHIDAVSFVSPKAVPQMADSEEVLEQLQPPQDVEIIGIVVNEKGAERAIATGRVTTLGYPCSVSETFLRRNQNQSLAQNIEVLRLIKRSADECKLEMVAYVSMAFGNPYGDPWDEAEIRRTFAQITSIGVRQISLADTVGAATPELIGRIVAPIIDDFAEAEIGVHLHGTRDDAAAKVLAAYDAGCRRFDSAIGGLGGCPFAQDKLVGNIPTETVLDGFGERGVNLPRLGSLEMVTTMTAQIGSEFGAAA
jgi:hydroxymethylglutaryl-CoA lyase